MTKGVKSINSFEATPHLISSSWPLSPSDTTRTNHGQPLPKLTKKQSFTEIALFHHCPNTVGLSSDVVDRAYPRGEVAPVALDSRQPADYHFAIRSSLPSSDCARNYRSSYGKLGPTDLDADSYSHPISGPSTLDLDGRNKHIDGTNILEPPILPDHPLSPQQPIPIYHPMPHNFDTTSDGIGLRGQKPARRKPNGTRSNAPVQPENVIRTKQAWDPMVETFLLERTLQKKFEKPSSSVTIAYSSKKRKIFSLMVRNAIETTPAAVILSLQVAVRIVIPRGKGKNPMLHPTIKPIMMNFII